MEQKLRIAVQSKGRLYEETMDLLSESGIKLAAVKRTLLVPSRNFPVELLFLRDDDIPESVANGTADIGIVGLNEVLEKNRDVKIIKELGFSRCRLSLAVPQHIGYQGLEWFNGRRIATSYPFILDKFLKDNNIEADIHVISGSVEIFDIVSSGSTLISNNLVEVSTVMESQAVLIAGNKADFDAEKQAVLDELLFRIDAVKAADGKKYILMNVPKDKLDKVLSILPGMKSPTVLPLANAEWCSVHSVLEEKKLWSTVSRLKEAGAESILTLDIEKMIL